MSGSHVALVLMESVLGLAGTEGGFRHQSAQQWCANPKNEVTIGLRFAKGKWKRPIETGVKARAVSPPHREQRLRKVDLQQFRRRYKLWPWQVIGVGIVLRNHKYVAGIQISSEKIHRMLPEKLHVVLKSPMSLEPDRTRVILSMLMNNCCRLPRGICPVSVSFCQPYCDSTGQQQGKSSFSFQRAGKITPNFLHTAGKQNSCGWN